MNREEISMTEHRWSKFWWQDWQADQALRSCSLAARGLWMDMLCIAHTGTPRGHVTINGVAVTPKRLAILTGSNERECIKLLSELEEAGVFSRTEAGVIYSRRMVRDNDAAEAGREAVERRWSKVRTPTADPITPPNRPNDRGGITLEAEAEAEAEADSKGESAPRAASPPRTGSGSRLPDDWKPEEPHYAGADPAVTLPRFCDYWRAQPGAKGRKTDWQATWRNWCRKDAEDRAARPKPKLHTLPPAEQDRRILAAVGLNFDDPKPTIIPMRIAQ
jgi:hypothetical protein